MKSNDRFNLLLIVNHKIDALAKLIKLTADSDLYIMTCHYLNKLWFNIIKNRDYM